MIPALVTAVFFVAIIAALQFSMWAEGWLKANAVRIEEQLPEAPPAANEFSDLVIEKVLPAA